MPLNSNQALETASYVIKEIMQDYTRRLSQVCILQIS